ncbi:type II toxin-antitoxin system RatA family toxin [Wolbachia endosymbiont of Howardula sp.]|uniref:type II toxin-antitoxin system RatA family toxin n=1 Tax=Wolbachia endosymbiont of Howardula sp. TaxID=2916816 RepID=UPI00217DB684|nr:type II toxin-antitoxin system RatA family toxin [Wolbachia endosymbiont of Howardula sp.]UWI83330.1 type II toxin-antitoxin system RatA family toxin [Wolbachia endosymbiont of Howardula sp.]
MIHKYTAQEIVLCTADRAFHIVYDIEQYPNFLPWCQSVCIKNRSDKMIVDMTISFQGIEATYTSEVHSLFSHELHKGWIKVVSTHGIFQYLYNEWKFVQIDQKKTIVIFYIEFILKSHSFSYLLKLVYRYIYNKMIDAFKIRMQFLNENQVS